MNGKYSYKEVQMCQAFSEFRSYNGLTPHSAHCAGEFENDVFFIRLDLPSKLIPYEIELFENGPQFPST